MKTIRTTSSRDLNYSATKIWKGISELSNYAAWWPSSIEIRSLNNTDALIGSRLEVRPYGGQAFYCEVSSLIDEKQLVLKYSGIYEGTGTWTISRLNGLCRVSYAIDLEIQSKWIRLVSFVLPIAAIHSKLLEQVLAGLDQYLGRLERLESQYPASPLKHSLQKNPGA